MNRALLLIALPLMLPSAAVAYTTPGYDGVRKAPKTKPVSAKTAVPIALPPGSQPANVVDDAGTAHIVLVPPANTQQSPVYCRIKRGATGCDNATSFLPPVTALKPSPATLPFDIDEVRAYSLGGSLLVVGAAHGGGPRRADGTAMPASVWLWESRDGGQSFDTPVLIGDGSMVLASAFGAADAPRFLGVRTDDTGGLFATVFTTAAIGAGETELLRDGRAFSAFSATTQDGVPISAYATPLGAHVLTPASDDRATDRSGYANANLPGTSISVAGGPAGVLAVTSVPRAPTADMTVRRVRRTVVDRAQPLGEGLQPKIAQSPAGAVAVAAFRRDAKGVTRLAVADGRDGTLQPPHTLELPAPMRTTLPDLRELAIGPDGGGFVLTSDAGGRAPAYAIGVGQTAPTGKPGLGGLPGGGGLPNGVSVSCGRVTIGKLVLRTLVGCLLPAADGSGRRVSESALRVGGMDVIPDAGVKIVIDPRKRRLDTTGNVTVRLRGGDLDIPIYRGDLHLTIPRGAAGDLLASFPTESTVHPKVGGFPVRGVIDATITAHGVRLAASLELPSALSGIRGQSMLETDDNGLRIPSVAIEADLIPVPGGEIRDLKIRYASAGSWGGGMRLVLHGGLELEFSVDFRDGDFIQGRIGVTKWPGIPIAKAVFLNRVAGDLKLQPGVVIGVEARVGAVPAYPSTGFVAGIDGRLQFSIPRQGPFEISVSGSGDILGITLARASTIVRSDGFFRQTGRIELDAAVASLRADLELAVDGQRGLFNAGFGLQACVFVLLGDACGSGQAVMSNVGFAACAEIDVEIFTGSAYFGYRFPKKPPYDFGQFEANVGDGCNDDLSGYKVPTQSRSARAAHAGQQIIIPARRRIANIELQSAEGTPAAVAAMSPTGERIPLDGSDRRAVAVQLPRAHRTIVLLRKPRAGAWRVEAGPAPALERTRVSVALPARRAITARVVRTDGTHQLRYVASPRSGERILFVERTRSGFERRLGTAGRSGRLSISRDDLGPGRRTIYAVREIDGLSRSRERVAAYVAPPPRRPGKPRRVEVKRTRTTAIIRWAPSALDTTRVIVSLRDGRRFARDVRAGRRSTTLRGLLPPDSGTVRVVLITRTGRSGAPVKVQVRPGGRRTR